MAGIARLFDQLGKIGGAPLHAVMLAKHGVLQPGGREKGFERGIVLKVVELARAALDAVKRRLRDVEKTLVDERRHLTEEEGEEQRPDVAAVDSGVGHDD